MDVQAIVDAVPGALGGALQLDGATFDSLETDVGRRWTAGLVVLLAGVSTTLGQSVALAANRVGRRRFVVSLGLGAFTLAGGAAFWAATIVGLAWIFGERSPSFFAVVAAVHLAYAPRVFGVLQLLPFLGLLIEELLLIWTFMALLVGVQEIVDVSLGTALALTLGGYFVLLFAMRTPARWFGIEGTSGWRVPALRVRELDTRRLVDGLAARLRLRISQTRARRRRRDDE